MSDTVAVKYKMYTPQMPYGSAPDMPPFTQAFSVGTAWNNHPIVHKLTLGQTLDQTVRFFGTQDALVYPDRNFRLTWRQFSDLVDSLARGLMSMGVKHGDKVAIWATNVPEWIPLLFATAKIGAIFIPVNMHLKKAEIDGVLTQSDTSWLFVTHGYRDANYIDILFDIVPELRYTPKNTNISCSKYPFLKRIFYIGEDIPNGFSSINDILDLKENTPVEEYLNRQKECKDNVTVCMQFTSGTTGNPKGVRLSHRNIGNNGYWIGACQNLSSRDRVCIPVPLFHCFGMVLGVMACVNHGAAMVMLEKYDPVQVMKAVDQEKCTALYGVPTMFIQLLDHPDFDKYNFSSLRTGIMSGSSCPVIRMQQCIERMNMEEITIPYGLTEAGPVMTQTRYFEPDIEKKCFSIGQALPGIEVAIINPDTGDFCDIDEDGEICCRGYNVMNGYYKEPVATYKFIDEYGWLHSGDVGRMDSDGYFYITGRLKDLIIRGGENISPKEVEDFISHIPGVKDVQVVAVPSKKYGEQPGAFIILQPDANLTEKDIQDACNNQIAWFKIPKYIAFVSEFPLTGSSKVQKFKLREMAAEIWKNEP